MKVIKNKNKSVCCVCCKKISLTEHPYKVKNSQDTFHLICFYRWLKKKIEKLEATISDLTKFKKELKKHHNTQLLLETLESNV